MPVRRGQGESRRTGPVWSEADRAAFEKSAAAQEELRNPTRTGGTRIAILPWIFQNAEEGTTGAALRDFFTGRGLSGGQILFAGLLAFTGGAIGLGIAGAAGAAGAGAAGAVAGGGLGTLLGFLGIGADIAGGALSAAGAVQQAEHDAAVAELEAGQQEQKADYLEEQAGLQGEQAVLQGESAEFARTSARARATGIAAQALGTTEEIAQAQGRAAAGAAVGGVAGGSTLRQAARFQRLAGMTTSMSTLSADIIREGGDLSRAEGLLAQRGSLLEQRGQLLEAGFARERADFLTEEADWLRRVGWAGAIATGLQTFGNVAEDWWEMDNA